MALDAVHLNVQDKCLEATNGRAYVQVPVEVEPGDQEANLDPQALVTARKQAAAAARKAGTALRKKLSRSGRREIAEDAGKAAVDLYRVPVNGQAVVDEGKPFPHIPVNLVELNRALETSLSDTTVITLNPKLLLDLAAAVGSEECVQLEIVKGMDAIRVTAPPMPGRGYLMLFRGNRSYTDQVLQAVLADQVNPGEHKSHEVAGPQP
jgi:hypothetical protein